MEVYITIKKGETLGLVGESGCGKTTTGRCIIRAIEPTSGKVFFRRNNETIDIMRLNSRGLDTLRRDVQLIFQDPYSSLNPRMTVRDIIGEPLVVNKIATPFKSEPSTSNNQTFQFKSAFLKVDPKPLRYLNRP